MRTFPVIALALAAACARAVQQPRDPARRVTNPVFTAAVVDVPPAVVQCPPTAYPATLREAGVHGTVVIEVVVDTLGHPEPQSLRIVQSPHDSLSAAARAVVLGCELTPGRIGRRPVRVLMQLPVQFGRQE